MTGLDATMRDGFSHGWGELDTNRQLVAWMREYNENRAEADRLAFHGFDAAMETMNAPSPRPCRLSNAMLKLKTSRSRLPS